MDSKQVIVMRKDLGMRKGKMISQGAHASLGGVLKLMKKKYNRDEFRYEYSLNVEEDSYLNEWLNGTFTKITVSVDSLEELMDIYKQAGDKNIPRCIITDAGKTEFKKPTVTCISLGPYWVNKIDEITGNLKLL